MSSPLDTNVVAITVFCLLVVAFYAFFAPFMGGEYGNMLSLAYIPLWYVNLSAHMLIDVNLYLLWTHVRIDNSVDENAYGHNALLVFILYVRCTAINPADPGIMSKFDPELRNEAREKHESIAHGLNRKFDEVSNGSHSCPSSASRSSYAGANSSKKGSVESVKSNAQVNFPRRRSFCYYFVGIFCGVFIHEDCQKQDEAAEQEGTGEDALYCTLCNAEVRKFSKHCRSCDKCVDGFDHHCRWLNNCVGRKNYVTFISLMAISLVWLVVEAGVGIGVLVRCFVHKSHMEAEIVDRLGNGFSRAPFATVVAICTAVSLLACVPLGELFFFHMILIRKGITTYEYVVAMRTMSEAPAGASVDEELPNILYSPSGSATTGFSGGSSLGLQYKGAWCTPPRVFCRLPGISLMLKFSEAAEEVAPQLGPGMVPSTVDPDAAVLGDKGNKGPKKGVRISAWKLAKLDSNEAMKAAAKARASSSVLRPVDNRRLPDSELSSSENASVRSSMSTDTGGNKDVRNEFRLSPLRNSFAPSQGSRDEYETGTQSVSSFSSPSHVHESVTLSPLPQARGFNPLAAASSVPALVPEQPLTSRVAVLSKNNPVFPSLSGFDEKIMQRHSSTDPLLLSAPAAQATSLIRDVKRTSVVWDQEAGRYVSVPVSASEARKRPSLPPPAAVTNPHSATGTQDKRPAVPPQESLRPLAKPEARQSEKLTYTGQSIFFGGPLLSAPIRDGLKREGASSSSDAQDKLAITLPRESRFKRDAVSNQLPIFVPGDSDSNPSPLSGPK
ncbi:putative protein S-acyltransferase 19 [Sesamum angolense]|uniref:S-acyltransferase n=1 Tax=Sesamum angolense TaxID=2727404 RepID=A0AAE2BI58_9LAMI|nr:putative protein S-acyltransferase 19 [Sesamum angolense]